ncbi:peptidoglycan recognition family protein [Streptomyces xanthophaeus]|uniref:peptidoglycan recognition protein family protein n=1 Tax=Streptomyces xanthophaeus TaxID=67385 RepID=UPI00398FC94E
MGAVLLAPAVAPTTARAAGASRIYARAVWQARSPRGRVLRAVGRPKRIIVHHTATANTPDLSRTRAFALARAIQSHHMDGFGWIDTGQHFTVSRGAYVLEGREGSLASLVGGERMVVGTHCSGQNGVSIGIETEGTYTHGTPPAQQYEALVELCARLCRRHRLAASEIYGHRDFNATLCPGDALYGLLPRLRQDVGAAGGEPQGTRRAAVTESAGGVWEELRTSALPFGDLWIDSH